MVQQLIYKSVFSFFPANFFLIVFCLPFISFLFVFLLRGPVCSFILHPLLFLLSDRPDSKERTIMYYPLINIFFTFICSLSIFLPFLVSITLLVSFTALDDAKILYIVKLGSFNWLKIDYLIQDFIFYFDPLTVSMISIICLVSFLVHLYSCLYLGFDPFYVRFISFLNLFTFFMIFMVLSGNIIQLFIGWEGVGLSSYLLINYWFTRFEANKSAFKAILVNKIGDVTLLLVIATLVSNFGTTSYSVLFSIIDSNVVLINNCHCFYYSIHFLFRYFDLFTFIAWLLFFSASAKSAQFFFHTWLPDAMEGPTPVSALLHAATMVTAGIYIVVRFSFLFELSESVRCACLIIGSVTALFGSLTALFQFDIKKIIAFSTTSQLGYMFVACGLSGYNLAMYHIFTHAFFKALLFLVSGVIIHNLNNEQDIRRMGNLLSLMPLTYIFVLTGLFSLSGFPFFSGFYSKDAIIELAYSGSSVLSFYAFLICLGSAALTSCYSARLLYYVFLNSFNISSIVRGTPLMILSHNPKIKRNKYYYRVDSRLGIQDMQSFFLLVLIPLFIGSICFGYFFNDLLLGCGSTFWGSSIVLFPDRSFYYEFFINKSIKMVILVLSSFGFFMTLLFFYFRIDDFSFRILGGFSALAFYRFLSKRWFVDIIYNKFVSSIFLDFSRVLYITVDKGYIDFTFIQGLIRAIKFLGKCLINLHSDYSMYISTIIFTFFIFFAFPG